MVQGQSTKVISMRTSRLSIKNSLSFGFRVQGSGHQDLRVGLDQRRVVGERLGQGPDPPPRRDPNAQRP